MDKSYLLFESVNEALTLFAKDPQWRLTGKIGFIGVLHTWSQTLMDHFYLHCLIPAGVLSFDENRWQPSRKKFLFKVTFSYRGRPDGNRKKPMTLEAEEFIQRFLLHVLPDGFMKIRYFGFLSHRNKNRCLPFIRKLINPQAEPPEQIKETVLEIMLRVTGVDITCCRACGHGKMRPIRGIEKPKIDDSS